MYGLGRKLLRSRAALAVLLLAVWSVALATPCLPDAFVPGSDMVQHDHGNSSDPCDQHGRDYKINASKAADDSRQLKLAALIGLFTPPLLVAAPLANVRPHPEESVPEARAPVYLATARLRI